VPIPNGPEGGIVPPHSVLAPETALRSVPPLPYPPLRSLSFSAAKALGNGGVVRAKWASSSEGPVAWSSSSADA